MKNMEPESVITEKTVADLQEQIVFLERELADAARDEIVLREVIINLGNKVQLLEQKLDTVKLKPYQY